MRYRSKLFLSFALIVLTSILLAIGIIYQISSDLLLKQLRNQLLSIVNSSASLIDGGMVGSINKPGLENTPAYKKILSTLQEVRNANRRQDVYVKYYAILRLDDNKQYFFVVDSEEDPKYASHYGDVYPNNEELLQNRGHPFVRKKFITNMWGTLLEAFSPIYNSKNEEVGVIGVTMSVDRVNAKMYDLLHRSLLGAFFAMIIGLIIAYFLARVVTKSLNQVYGVVGKITEGKFDSRVYLNTEDEFDDLALALNGMAKGLGDREKLKKGFASYVSKFMLEKILKSGTQTKLEGERRKVTILFSDIRQFTSLSEVLPPEEVVAILNEYLSVMIDVIFKYRGMLDKFVGDGIMVEFGAPLEDPLQEKNAIQAALEMRLEIAKLSETLALRGKPKLEIGIGIHTGLAVLGNIGSQIKMGYTAIGDTVNVAARLQKATREYHKDILLSESTYQALNTEFTFEEVGVIHLMGRENPIKTYTIKS